MCELWSLVPSNVKTFFPFKKLQKCLLTCTYRGQRTTSSSQLCFSFLCEFQLDLRSSGSDLRVFLWPRLTSVILGFEPLECWLFSYLSRSRAIHSSIFCEELLWNCSVKNRVGAKEMAQWESVLLVHTWEPGMVPQHAFRHTQTNGCGCASLELWYCWEQRQKDHWTAGHQLSSRSIVVLRVTEQGMERWLSG